MKNSIENYFENLALYSRNLLDKLPIELEPQPLDYAVKKLFGKLNEIKDSEVSSLKQLWSKEASIDVSNNFPPGLNTIGLLTDRLTILLIKEWCLRNKNGNAEKANELYSTQTMDIIRAIAHCHPGSSSVNSKITNLKVEVDVKDWEETFYGMLSINLVLWESQELLYIKDIKNSPPEELKDYITWFAYGNMHRNILIELCEKHYWVQFNTK